MTWSHPAGTNPAAGPGRRGQTPPRPTMPPNAPPLRFLNQSVLDAATVFPADVRPRNLESSTLEHPRVVEDMRHGYEEALSEDDGAAAI